MSVISKKELENLLCGDEKYTDETIKKYKVYNQYIPVVTGLQKIYENILSKNDSDKLQKIKEEFLNILDYIINTPERELNSYMDREEELRKNIADRKTVIYKFIKDTDNEVCKNCLDELKKQEYQDSTKYIHGSDKDSESIKKDVDQIFLSGLSQIEKFTMTHMQRETELYYREGKEVDFFDEFKSISGFSDLYGELGKMNKKEALTNIAKNTLQNDIEDMIKYTKILEKTNILNYKEMSAKKEKMKVIVERTLEVTGLRDYISRSVTDEVKYI